MNKNIYDLLIIGSGPAGLNAALYASRANLKVGFVEKGTPGGKLSLTEKVENWLGTTIINGADLAQEFFSHAMNFGAEFIYGEVVEIINHADYDKELKLADGSSLFAKTILIATGMINRKPSFVKNADNLINKGISFCAVCDGPLFGKNPTLVLGGGNSAVEEGTLLSKIASEVHIVIKDDDFTAEKKLVEDLLSKENVFVYKNHQIEEVIGTERLESAILVDKDGNKKEIKVASFFPYIGMIPAASFAKSLNITNEFGFIPTDENMETKIKGIFAAGDIRSKKVRQIVTAASDGAIAAKYISDILG